MALQNATPLGGPDHDLFTKKELDWLHQDQNLFGFLGELPSDQGLQARRLNRTPKNSVLCIEVG